MHYIQNSSLACFVNLDACDKMSPYETRTLICYQTLPRGSLFRIYLRFTSQNKLENRNIQFPWDSRIFQYRLHIYPFYINIQIIDYILFVYKIKHILTNDDQRLCHTTRYAKKIIVL